MNHIIWNQELKIENMIFQMRGRQVMLDSDLAKLYGVETKRINEAVKNNPYKFPERFSWIITKEGADIISRSKFSTLNDEKLQYIFSKFDQKEQLFLPGETYDAYSSIIDILMNAKEEIVIIDSYADKTILDIVKNMDVSITIITSKKAKLTSLEIEKFNKQYDKLKVIYSNTFHDRYLIIDKKEVYHVGSSLNHAGEKLFSLNHLKDKMVKDNLINYTYKIIVDDYLEV